MRLASSASRLIGIPSSARSASAACAASCSTKSGTPSAASRIAVASSSSSTSRSGSASTRSRASSPPSGWSTVAPSPQAGRRSRSSGLVTETTSMGPSTARTTYSTRSRKVGTAQWRSSSTTTTGPWAAKCPRSVRAAASAASALSSSPSAGALLVERGGAVGQLAERQEGDALAVGGARGVEHDGVDVVRECRDEAALADPRLAHDDDVAGLLGLDHALERRVEARELLRPPDQRRQIHARSRPDGADTEETAVRVRARTRRPPDVRRSP